MRFNKLKYVLFPISFLYGIVIHIRNFLFDKQILHSSSFKVPTICIGNIAVGGTGKTPMAEFIIRHLKNDYKIILLSRGYKRMTKGFIVADSNSTAEDIGDEPLQIYKKFPDIKVIVCEKRADALAIIEKEADSKTLVILDDAFQHRAVTTDQNIVLTDYSHIYYKDFFLPVGSLRDQRSSMQRATQIIVTKCPENLSEKERHTILKNINYHPNIPVHFSTMQYGKIYNAFTQNLYLPEKKDTIIALTGIARPQPFIQYLRQYSENIQTEIFPDHHAFTEKDIQSLIDKYLALRKNSNTFIVTTEKDAVRLEKYKSIFQKSHVDFFILPLENSILFQEENLLIGTITKYLNNNQ